MKQGADKILIDALKNAAKEEKIQNINDTFENIKSSVIDTLSKKNLLEEAKKEINIENAEKINATADQIRNGITNGLKNIIQ
jgi:inorganic pyrophosphatase